MSTAFGASAGTTGDRAIIGFAAWSNTDNVKVNDDPPNDASVFMAAGQSSHYLTATNWGFAIPAGATIDGIAVEIHRNSDQSMAVYDDSVRLLIDNEPAGGNKADPWPWNPLPPSAPHSYGGPADQWLFSPPAAEQINATGFGIALAVCSPDYDGTALVNYISITVYYTEGGQPAWMPQVMYF